MTTSAAGVTAPEDQRRQSPARALFHNQLKALPDHQTSAVRERFFTASLAGALDSSLALRRRFVSRLVGGASWRGHTISRAEIAVDLEVPETGGGRDTGDRYWLDLVLTINGQERVAVEVKLDASEGVDSEGRRQLDRYLRLKTVGGVAFVTAALTEVAASAWKQREGKYLVPRSADRACLRRHFLWSDFYPDVTAVAKIRNPNPLVVALLGLLDRRGLQSAHKLIGDLGGRTPFDQASPQIRENRLQLQKAMQGVQRALSDGGRWQAKSKVRNNGSFFLYPPDGAPGAQEINVSSIPVPGVVQVWINLDSAAVCEALTLRLERKLGSILTKAFHGEVSPTVLTPPRAMYHAVTVWLPYAAMLRGVRNAAGVEPRITTALRAVFDIVHQVSHSTTA